MSRGLDNFHSQYLYRVLRPNESPNQDIVCCDRSSQRTVDEHVETGLTQPSRFISTTSDLTAALRWIGTANEKSFLRYRNVRTVIVKIDVQLLKSRYGQIAAAAYDLSNSLNREAFLKTEKQKKFSESYHEIVFMDRIPSDVFSTCSKNSNESDEESNSVQSSASGFSAVPINLRQIDTNRINKPTPAFGTNSNSAKYNSLQSASSIYNILDIPNNNLHYPNNSQTSSSSNFSTFPVNRAQDDAPLTYNPSLGRTLGAESSPIRSNYVQSASQVNLFSTKANPEIDSKKAAKLRKLPGIDISPSPLKPPQTDTAIYQGLIREASDTSLLPVFNTSNDTSTTDKWASTISPVNPATSISHLRRNLFKQDTHSPKFLRDQPTPDILNGNESSVHEPRSKEFLSSVLLSNYNQSSKSIEKFESKAKSPTNTPMAARTHSSAARKVKLDDKTDISFLLNKKMHPTKPISSDFQSVSPMNEIKTSSGHEIGPKTATICRVLPDSTQSFFPVKRQHFDTIKSDKSIKCPTPESNPVRSNYPRSVSSMSKMNNSPPTDHGLVDVTNNSQQTSTINPVNPATSTSHLRGTLFTQDRHSQKFLRDSFSSHTNSRPIYYPPSHTSLTTELNENTPTPVISTENASSVHELRSKESQSSVFLSNYNQFNKSIEKIKSKDRSPTNTPMAARAHSSAASKVKLDDKTGDMSSASDISFLLNKKTHLTKPISSDFQSVSPMNEIKTSSGHEIDPKTATICRVLPDSTQSFFPVKRQHFDTIKSDKSIKSPTPESNPVRSNYPRSVSSMSKMNNSPPTDHGLVDVTNNSQQTSTINPVNPATSTSHLRGTLFTQDRYSPKLLRDSFSSHTKSRPIHYPPSHTSLEKTLIPVISTEKTSSVHEPKSKESHSSILLNNYNQFSKSFEKIKSKARSPTNTPMAARTHSSAASNVELDDKTGDTVAPICRREKSPNV